MGWVPGWGEGAGGFAVALGQTDHFQKEEMEMARNWQRRTDIPRERMPETESKALSFQALFW